VGRHYAVIEAMAAITIVDALMMARGYDNVCRVENRWREL
jgi:chorismate synthase